MALAPAQLFRWRANSWQAGGKAGPVQIAVDVQGGVGSGKISLMGADSAVAWWREIHFSAAVTIETSQPQRAIVMNGDKQFALLFEDKDSALRFSKRFADAVLELRAARFTVVKTKKLLEMTRELERLRAENKALSRRSTQGQSSPLRASAPAAALSGNSSPPDDAKKALAAATVPPPRAVNIPLLKARSLRVPLDHASSRSNLMGASLNSPSASVDAIVTNVARNSMIRLSGTSLQTLSTWIPRSPADPLSGPLI